MPPNSRRGARKTNQAPPHSERPSRRKAKRPRNLSLTPEAIARGEAYSAERGTTLSAVVEQFLRALPTRVDLNDAALDPGERRRREIEYVRTRTTSPLVRELAGLLAGSEIAERDPRELYREHLWRKHGRR